MIDKNNIKKVSDKIYAKYPKLKNNKKNILYCPTFREGNYDYKYIKEFIDKFNYKKYNLVVKLHPLTKYKFNNDKVIFVLEDIHHLCNFSTSHKVGSICWYTTGRQDVCCSIIP